MYVRLFVAIIFSSSRDIHENHTLYREYNVLPSFVVVVVVFATSFNNNYGLRFLLTISINPG